MALELNRQIESRLYLFWGYAGGVVNIFVPAGRSFLKSFLSGECKNGFPSGTHQVYLACEQRCEGHTTGQLSRFDIILSVQRLDHSHACIDKKLVGHFEIAHKGPARGLLALRQNVLVNPWQDIGQMRTQILG